MSDNAMVASVVDVTAGASWALTVVPTAVAASTMAEQASAR